MNRLKLSGSQWAGYTGVIGTVDFKDGISVDPVPRALADRLSAAIRMIEVDADGNELGDAGIATRLIRDSAMRAPIVPKLERQSDAERKVEDALERKKSSAPPVTPINTMAELEKIADESGIKGLRVIGDAWGIKGRKIPELILNILAAQSKFIAARDKSIQPAEPAPTPVVEPEATIVVEEPAPVIDDQLSLPDVIVEGAISGDLAAAISVTPDEQSEG